MNVSAPTLIVAVRCVIEVFAATVKLTVPAPEPLAPLVIVTQPAPLVVDQAHPLPAVTANDPVPPEAGIVVPPDESAYEHAAAAWLIVKVWPATEMVALRADVPVFSATVNATVPSADPVAPLVIVTHAADELLFQPQPLAAVTLNEALPPAAGAE